MGRPPLLRFIVFLPPIIAEIGPLGAKGAFSIIKLINTDRKNVAVLKVIINA
jgi:hypothetical protein